LIVHTHTYTYTYTDPEEDQQEELSEIKPRHEDREAPFEADRDDLHGFRQWIGSLAFRGSLRGEQRFQRRRRDG